jgi:hypothetical protein
MKRREFVEKTCCGALGAMMAFLGLTSCKKEEAPAEEAAAQAPAPPPSKEAPVEEMNRKALVKKMLMEKKGITEEEADAQIVSFEETVPWVKEKCICKTCPTYVTEETEVGFCHPLIGKSKTITEEKGCNCPQCPVYTEKQMKNGYYCTRNSEMEQEMAKTAM